MIRGLRILRRLCRWLIALAGISAIIIFALCFTDVPWKVYHWLGNDAHRLGDEPEYIVVLGGGGVPSESGLTRAYAAAQFATKFEDAWVVLALPYEKDFETSAAGKMQAELVLRGVENDRILLESKGRNTREQAVNTSKRIDADPAETPVMVVTSPEHMKRALLAFRRAGFGNVSGGPAYSEAIEMNLRYDPSDLGGHELVNTDLGGTLIVRYEFWNNISYLTSSAREFVALVYYKLMGWI